MSVEFDVRDSEMVRGFRSVKVTEENPLPVILVGGGGGGLTEVNVPDDIVATGTPSATTYLRGDGSWTTPTDTNTTYTALTAAQAQTGTATTAQTISAKVLADELTRRIPANELPAVPGAGTFTLTATDGVLSWVAVTP